MSTTVEMTRQPECDICKFVDGVPNVGAWYDVKTIQGPWANVCEAHFRSHTTQELGTGHGQRFTFKN